MKGYVQLRRGLADHFKVMSSSELKVYIGVLLLANYRTAIVNITLAELSDYVNLDKKIVMENLHRLEKFGYVKYTPAKNQWHNNSIKIINYNGKVKNTTPIPTPIPIAIPTPIPIANAVSGNEINDLQNPNNIKNIKKYKEIVSKDTTQGKKTPCDTDLVFKDFCNKYKEIFEKDYIANFGKDKALIKKLLKIIPSTEIVELVDKFFNSTDTFIAKSNYDIGIFYSQINKLRIGKRTDLTPAQQYSITSMRKLETRLSKESQNEVRNI